MTDKELAKLDQIRCGKFVATSSDHFALSFQIMQIRDGIPRPLCVCGSMPVIETRWAGSGHPIFRQSLQ